MITRREAILAAVAGPAAASLAVASLSAVVAQGAETSGKQPMRSMVFDWKNWIRKRRRLARSERCLIRRLSRWIGWNATLRR